MVTAYVGVGSNIEPETVVPRAVASLRARFGTVACSPVYRSAAVGFDGDPFLNLVCRFATDLPVMNLDRLLHGIETDHGRSRDAPRFAARTLDLDLLLYGELRLNDGRLRLPRDEITQYAFVLRPLAELAPQLRHPSDGRTMAELWRRFAHAAPALEAVQLDLGPAADPDARG